MGQIPEVDRTGTVVTAQRDADFAGGVVNTQLVGTAALVFLAFDGRQRLQLGQFVRRQMHAVVEAAGDQRLIRVALQKGNQHFHAHARQVDRAEALARPVRCNPHPAAGFVVELAFAVPVELDFDPAVFVAVDLFASRASDDRTLAAQYLGLGVIQWRAIRNVPRNRAKGIAIALLKVVF